MAAFTDELMLEIGKARERLEAYRLNQLTLPVKQSFKFLDTFGFSFKKPSMVFIRHSDKIHYSIIISDAIKVMDYPSFRKTPAISFLPDQYMLKSLFAIRATNPNITIRCLIFATFPIIALVPTLSIPNSVLQTALRCISDKFPTDWTRFVLFLRVSIIGGTCHTFMGAILLMAITSLKCFVTKDTSIFIPHTRSISQNLIFYKYLVAINKSDLLKKMAKAIK